MTEVTENKKTETKSKIKAIVPQGFTDLQDVSDTSCRGWYKPGLCETLYGTISGSFSKQVTDPKTGLVRVQTFVKITLATEYECIAADPDNEKITRSVKEETRVMKFFMAQPGDTIGVKIRSKCEMLLDYEPGAKVMLEALGKTAIRGGAQSMWNFRVGIKGKQKPVTHVKPAPAPVDDSDDFDPIA